MIEAVVEKFFDDGSQYSGETVRAGDSSMKLDLAIRAEYLDVFEKPKRIPPRKPNLGIGDFCICLISRSKPPYWLPYIMTPAERDEYTKLIAEFKRNGLIRDSQSQFAVQSLFVPKFLLPDGLKELQMVIIYWVLNEITIKDRFLLPLPECNDRER
jgi:hypothetical protein